MNEAIESLQMVSNVHLSTAQMNELIAGTSAEELIVKWEEIDTEVREKLADLLCEKLLSKSWPSYSDNVDTDQFYKELQESAKANGYKVGS
ncbi:hypothetical protein J4N45_11055 [Vibrio sp. SCSIO 43140]|uniref:hypothetical protein n=1 Tax=Vibrio sp. SCSIO 43140 TaxID=2819100 RepID=UPI002074FC45|nr:hypothetical protein [Vibrio sp. SCSIO 43140]USD59069.1 hypothetical protein J4N45_11055 [Vibrio sp. SCSIO 43140]